MQLGEYIYVNPRKIIHVSRKCPKLNYMESKLQRFKAEELRELSQQRDETIFCAHYISDKDYEALVMY